MATLLRTLLGRPRNDEISRYSLQQYIRDLQNAQFGFGALGAATTQNNGRPAEDIENSFTGYVNGAYKRNGVIFAIILSRLLLFTEARFCFRDSSGKLTTDPRALALLRRPWPNGTTGELLARMEQDVSLGGNFYCVNEGDRLRRLRPDWVSIILSAPPEQALASDVIGYQYSPGGIGGGEAEYFLPDEICHWSPIPDPDAQYRGMSWLTPVIEEITADGQATTHKRKFFEQGATPQVIVKVPAEVTITQFKEYVAASRNATEGVENAHKTWYVGGGADPTVVGANLQQMDFKATQGAGETRICAAGGVPPIIVGLSEGLSSATYSNYGMARRKFGDHWARPSWRSACAALSVLVDVPDDKELWYLDRDIAFLREDQKDAAEIQHVKAMTINSYVINGFTPKSAVAAVEADDRSLLEHTGLTSVQLLPPGQESGTPPPDADLQPAAEPAPAKDAAGEVERRYNPAQRRGTHTGKWVGADLGSATADRLKLAARLKLRPGEKLMASSKVDGELGGARFALTIHNGRPELRVGFGAEGYGKRDRESGTPAWDGNPTPERLSDAERDRLSAEIDATEGEYESASPERRKEIDERDADIREQLAAGEGEFNGTTRIGARDTDALVGELRPALAEAVVRDKAENKAWDEIEQLQATGNPDPQRLAELRQIVDRGTEYLAKGVVPGAWGDIHYEVYLDDAALGPQMVLGVWPKGAPDDWGATRDWSGIYDMAEARKVLSQLEQMRAGMAESSA